ncbi:hypothetical protein BDL97_14G095700 [Sphagnum fallax]|nr:hypothetical protein BDL97_14G095700 [Sphagnum fallax]
MNNMVGVDQLTLNSRRGLTAVELCCFFFSTVMLAVKDMSITMTAIELPLLLGYVVSQHCTILAIKGTTPSHLRKKKVVCYVMLL